MLRGCCILGVMFAVGSVGCRDKVSEDNIRVPNKETNETIAVKAEVNLPTLPTAGLYPVKPEEPIWADNSYCYVCHLNYQGEELTHNHEISGVGCEMCHGISDRHSADEDGLTPPDRMFPKVKINTFCTECHVKGNIEHINVHKPLFNKAVDDKNVCTDCHGKHRLNVRTRVWDKETGELISDDGVRMMGDDSSTVPDL